jgi:biopolymer transport protein ExbB
LNQPTLQDEIKAGGIWVFPIIGFFLLSILIAIFKLFEIYAVKRPKESVIQEILTLVNSGKKDEALKMAESISGPFGTMLTDAVTFSSDSRELLEEVLYERMLETQPKLERLLPFIAVTAATAPLLGLLGTVTGMINTFQQITLFGTSDASKLAGGISEALITTKYGLITAIPALIMHALLARRAQGVMASMEKYAAAFVNGLKTNSGQ